MSRQARRIKQLRRVYDRVVHFDERSREFPARAAIRSFAPRSRTWTCYVNLDQGVEGMCAGFAVSHEAASTPAVVPGITNAVARQVYRQAQRLDEWPGESYSGTSVLAAMKAGKARGWWAGYRWAFGEKDLAFALGYLGPAVLGVNWYAGMETPDAAGQIHATGELMGGHAILCIGYDAAKKLYRLHNSWGKTWCIGGDCFISAVDMVKLLSENGEAAIPMKRSVPK